jgi:hypothetical protein
VSYALKDSAGVQRDIDIFKRYLGDTTSPARAFRPSASYLYNGNGATWDMSPTMQRGINPPGTAPQSGALIEDALRLTGGAGDSVKCCTPGLAGISYQEEGFDAMLSTAQLLRAHGLDLRHFQTDAMKRAYSFYMTHGGPSDENTNHGYLPYAINYLYGTNFSTTVKPDGVHRHLGYGGWLFS